MHLSPELLLSAYAQGIFPMADADGAINWYEPRIRAVIPLDESFHIPRRLARTVRKGSFTVRMNTAFSTVMAACATTTEDRPSTWISAEMIAAYTELHRRGHAHSVECWLADELVGGLYGVSLGGLFAGESMFSRVRDASKVALVHLVERLRTRGFILLDSQYIVGPHMRQFGTQEISRAEYHRRLRAALQVEAQFAG